MQLGSAQRRKRIPILHVVVVTLLMAMTRGLDVRARRS